MKKMFKTVASLALGCALLSTSAFAALTGGVEESATAGTYTATVTKADATAWESTILVLKAGSVDATGAEPVIASTVNDGDIYYINQTSAKSDTATYSIAETTEKLYVFAGGSDETAAKFLGAIEANVPVTGVAITGAEAGATVYVGKTLQLGATVDPETATDKTVTWSASNANATVDANGLVTGVAAGDVVITAKAGDKEATIALVIAEEVVVPSVNAVVIKNGENATTAEYLQVGKQLTLTAEIDPSTSTETVVWSSADDEIATVENGVITAVKEGVVNITATAGDKSATVAITTYTLGNVYVDENIDLADVGAVLDHVKGIATITDELLLLKANAYLDENIDLADVGAILDHVKGIAPLK